VLTQAAAEGKLVVFVSGMDAHHLEGFLEDHASLDFLAEGEELRIVAGSEAAVDAVAGSVVVGTADAAEVEACPVQTLPAD
jgi:hypothetical protein